MYRHPNGAINQQELAKIKRGQRSRLFKFLSRALWPDENATKRGDEIARLFGVNAKKVNNIRQGASHLPAETDLNELHRSIDELVKAVDDPNVTAAWKEVKNDLSSLLPPTDRERDSCRKHAHTTSRSEPAPRRNRGRPSRASVLENSELENDGLGTDLRQGKSLYVGDTIVIAVGNVEVRVIMKDLTHFTVTSTSEGGVEIRKLD